MGEGDKRAGMEALIVVDTDILIDHFRGVQEATDYLRSIPPFRRATTEDCPSQQRLPGGLWSCSNDFPSPMA